MTWWSGRPTSRGAWARRPSTRGSGRPGTCPTTATWRRAPPWGGMFFHRNLGLLLEDGGSFDEVERALYNGDLSGVALKGDSYFYENSLESRGRSRWGWHGCPCRPPMFLKAVAGIPELAYAVDADGLLINLYLGSRARLELGGVRWVIRQTTRYPWDGEVRLSLDPREAGGHGPAAASPRLVPGRVGHPGGRSPRGAPDRARLPLPRAGVGRRPPRGARTSRSRVARCPSPPPSRPCRTSPTRTAPRATSPSGSPSP